MGRQKKDKLKLDIREMNGKYYAYESTSEWDPLRGKVTKTVYIGKWDPISETIMPKKAHAAYRSKMDAPSFSTEAYCGEIQNHDSLPPSSDSHDEICRSSNALESMFTSIVSLLRTNGPMSVNELAVAMGYKSANPSIRRMIKTMMLCGKVHYLYPESPRAGKQKIVLDE